LKPTTRTANAPITASGTSCSEAGSVPEGPVVVTVSVTVAAGDWGEPSSLVAGDVGVSVTVGVVLGVGVGSGVGVGVDVGVGDGVCVSPAVA